MSQLRPVWLLLIGTSAALACYLATVLMVRAGYTSPVLPLSSGVTLAAVGLIVLILGLVVWRDQRRLAEKTPARGRRMHPLQAARVVAAGQACAYAGALIAGWHAGVLMDLAPAAGAGTPNVTAAIVMVTGGMLWVLIGFIVEQLCRVPPDQGGDTPADDENVEGFDQEPGTGYANRAHYRDQTDIADLSAGSPARETV